MRNLIKKILKESNEMDWIRDVGLIPPASPINPNFVLVVDTLKGSPCGPQETMFKSGYRWAGNIPSIHGNPQECKEKPIHNDYIALIPYIGSSNFIDGLRTFGLVPISPRFLDENGKHEFMSEIMNGDAFIYGPTKPITILWSDIVGVEPDFNFNDMIEWGDNTIHESSEFDWIRSVEVNPWLTYDLILFTTVPTKKHVTKLIELALEHVVTDNDNRKSWEDPLIMDCNANRIITNASDRNPYLRIYNYSGKTNLVWDTSYGDDVDFTVNNIITYDKIKNLLN